MSCSGVLRTRMQLLSLCALMVLALAAAGCRSWRVPAIDPSGDHILLPNQSTTLVAPSGRLPGFPQPAFTTPPDAPPCPPGMLPGDAAVDAACQPPAIGAGVAAPVGALTLTPARTVAPVGSEVVLMSGVGAANGTYKTRERIEWLLSQDSVGHFVEVGGERRGVFHWASKHGSRKLSNNYAIARTSRRAEVITRGTPQRTDDIWLPKGQSWISVTAASEGISHVTAHAPDADLGQQRRGLATIYWVDAQWQLPATAIAREGQAVPLTTIVTRSSDAAPLAGWLVRYEVTGASAARIGPDGQTAVEVPTDAQGRATVQLTPPPQGSATLVQIQIIRPAAPGGAPRMVVGQGVTTVTWNAPALAVRVAGPPQADVGAAIPYRIEVTNPGTMTASGIKLTATMPPGMSYLDSTPPGQVFGDRVEWTLSDLTAQGGAAVTMRCRGDRRGSMHVCAVASDGRGLEAQGCADTRVYSPALKVAMTGPETAKIGDQVQYKIEITNISEQPVTGIRLSDRFDAGLEHADGGVSPIVRDLADLPAGQSHQIAVTFNVRGAGRLCHYLDVAADGGETASASACLTVPAAEVQPPPQQQQGKLRLQVFAPAQRRVGEIAEMVIDVTNTGQAAVNEVRIADAYPASQTPQLATKNFLHEAGKMSWLVTRLEVGQSVRLQVNYQCLRVDPAAPHTVTVTTKEQLSAQQQTTIEIVAALQPPVIPEPDNKPPNNTVPDVPNVPDPLPPAAGNLQITLADQGDPIRTGQETTYLIIVKNDRAVSDKNVQLSIALPEGMQIVKFTGPAKHKTSQDFRTLQVDPIQEIRAGETLPPFRLQVKATRTGKLRLRVQVQSARTTEPVIAEEDTTVLLP